MLSCRIRHNRAIPLNNKFFEYLVCCRCWLLVVGCWLLVVGCWLLVVGGWLLLLVVGCWLLVVPSRQSHAVIIVSKWCQLVSMPDEIYRGWTAYRFLWLVVCGWLVWVGWLVGRLVGWLVGCTHRAICMFDP